MGNGPPSGSATTGAIFDSVWATGMTDNSAYDSGDGWQHYYNPDTSQVNFGWHTANGFASSWNALAVAFKALND
jgi:hypothetical protein